MTNKEELQKHIQLLNEIKSRYPILNDTIKYLEKLEQLNNIFSDNHICEIKARFNEIECDADKCDNCPLAIGEDICLKITFENKWKFQEERDKLKELTHQPTLSECIKKWEEKGWELSDIHKHLDLGTNYYFLEKDMPHRNLNININYKQIRCSDSNGDAEELELDELELAIKTLKALEVEESVLV